MRSIRQGRVLQEQQQQLKALSLSPSTATIYVKAGLHKQLYHALRQFRGHK